MAVFEDVVLALGKKFRVKQLLDIGGVSVSDKYKAPRNSGEVVTAKGYVSGHGGDVWWFQHKNGDIAVYRIDEVEEV